MINIIAIACGGALGAIMRMGVSNFVSGYNFMALPMGTLVVNVLGSWSLGFFYAILSGMAMSTPLRLFISVGLLGAFTTFSTYSMDILILFRNEHFQMGVLMMVLHNGLGVLSAFMGYWIGSRILL